jgi:peptide/nickel transport system permease protein
MIPFSIKRLLSTLPTLFVVTVIVFAIVRVLPGNPARLLLGEEATPQLVAELTHQMGLDRPLPVQYASWLVGILQGDFGRSIKDNMSVGKLILEKLPTTLELAVLATLVSVLIALPAGIVTAAKRGGFTDGLITVLALSGVSLPNFFLGILLIYLFSIQLNWIPPSGYMTPLENPLENLRLMLLPAITLGLGTAGALTRFLRGAMLEVLGQDYVRTARAKGVMGRIVLYRHALRNALIPVVTIFGLQLGGLLGGAVITEQIFSIPGFGRLIVDAVFTRDFPVVQGIVLVSAIAIFLVSFLVDLIYAAIDPRIRYR